MRKLRILIAAIVSNSGANILSESTHLGNEYTKRELMRTRNPRVEFARAYVLSLEKGATRPLMHSSEFRDYGSARTTPNYCARASRFSTSS